MHGLSVWSLYIVPITPTRITWSMTSLYPCLFKLAITRCAMLLLFGVGDQA